MMQKLIGTTDDFGVMVTRVVLGAVMFPHGAQKVLGWFGGYGFGPTLDAFVTQMGIPVPLALLAFAAEFLGGLGLIVGLFGRVAAFGVLSVMTVAASMHLQHGFFMNWAGTQGGEGYEFHLLAGAMAIAVIIRGSGALSLDRLLSRDSRAGRTVALPRAA
jgi:putative oxidoreductase